MGEQQNIRLLITVGLGAALVAVRGDDPVVIAGAYVAWVTWPLVVADVRERRLPNVLVLPGYLVTGIAVVWHAARGAAASGASAASGAGALAVVLCGMAVLIFFVVVWRGGGDGGCETGRAARLCDGGSGGAGRG